MNGTHAKTAPPRPRPWLVRAAAAFRRHPLRTLRRGETELVDRIEQGNDELVEHTGFSLGPCLVIAAFTVSVVSWVALQLWRLR